jgi:CelD/BcsL family acetyltransferase involved in cellulose biosynthesis
MNLRALMKDISVFQTSVEQTPDLQQMWIELQDRAEGSLFLSWAWIGSWLACVQTTLNVQVVRAERNGLVVGLALFVVAPLRRLGVRIGKVAHIHSTGRPQFDDLTIEHNGLLLDRRHAGAAQAAMLHFLCDKQREWRAVRFPGLTSRQNILAGALPQSVVMEVQVRDSARVLLQPVRDRDGDYLGLLSSGRRAHIRRSIRACAALGPLVLTEANDAESATAYFERLLQLHRARRAKLGRPSGFDTTFAREFHRRLIERGLPRGKVQLVRVQAGVHDVGYLYSLVYRGLVCFYQSGYDYSLVDHRFSPGLVTVAMAIEHNARLGHHCFDFLAGDAQYKKTLATQSEHMYWVDLYRDGLAHRAESAARAFGKRGKDWLSARLA